MNKEVCGFGKAWVGPCQNKPTYYGRCDEHKDEKCCSCGRPATHTCDETGQFVCGAPLCKDCEHTIFPEGHNGGVGFNEQALPEGMERHCKKSDQKYKPWYMRKGEEI